jgi:hypothetical protein
MYLRSSNEIRTKYLRNSSYEWQGRNRSVLSRSRSVAQWRYRRISGQLTNLLRATYFRIEIFDVWDWALSNKCSAHVSNVPIIIFFLICVCRLVLGICNHTPPTTLSNSDLTLLSVCLSVYIGFRHEELLSALCCGIMLRSKQKVPGLTEARLLPVLLET